MWNHPPRDRSAGGIRPRLLRKVRFRITSLAGADFFDVKPDFTVLDIDDGQQHSVADLNGVADRKLQFKIVH